jgi:hypothetical protein
MNRKKRQFGSGLPVFNSVNPLILQIPIIARRSLNDNFVTGESHAETRVKPKFTAKVIPPADSIHQAAAGAYGRIGKPDRRRVGD